MKRSKQQSKQESKPINEEKRNAYYSRLRKGMTEREVIDAFEGAGPQTKRKNAEMLNRNNKIEMYGREFNLMFAEAGDHKKFMKGEAWFYDTPRWQIKLYFTKGILEEFAIEDYDEKSVTESESRKAANAQSSKKPVNLPVDLDQMINAITRISKGDAQKKGKECWRRVEKMKRTDKFESIMELILDKLLLRDDLGFAYFFAMEFPDDAPAPESGLKNMGEFKRKAADLYIKEEFDKLRRGEYPRNPEEAGRQLWKAIKDSAAAYPQEDIEKIYTTHLLVLLQKSHDVPSLIKFMSAFPGSQAINSDDYINLGECRDAMEASYWINALAKSDATDYDYNAQSTLKALISCLKRMEHIDEEFYSTATTVCINKLIECVNNYQTSNSMVSKTLGRELCIVLCGVFCIKGSPQNWSLPAGGSRTVTIATVFEGLLDGGDLFSSANQYEGIEDKVETEKKRLKRHKAARKLAGINISLKKEKRR